MKLHPPVSVCIIGLNEEKKIGGCLESVRELADEIIYVDSLSTDASVRIARSHGAKIISQKFLGHVEQKNLAVDRARNDWVLCLDCDERISEDLKHELVQFFIDRQENLISGEIRAVSFNRLTFYIWRWIRHSGWYPDRKIRLFNRRHCRWQGENPHDRVECPPEFTRDLKGDILHFSFDSISDHLKTIESFSTIGAREAFAKGRKAGLFTIVFRSLWVGFRKLFLEAAFLDGMAGIILTGLSVAATWAKYSKLYVLHRTAKDAEFTEKERGEIR